MVKSRRRALVLRRNLRILRSLTNSKSVGRASILSDAVQYIQELKSKIEALEMKQNESEVPFVVKVEKYENGMCGIRVWCCEKVEGLLVRVLEGLEGLGVELMHARVFCRDCFSMEAFGKEVGPSIDGKVMKETLVSALMKVKAI